MTFVCFDRIHRLESVCHSPGLPFEQTVWITAQQPWQGDCVIGS